VLAIKVTFGLATIDRAALAWISGQRMFAAGSIAAGITGCGARTWICAWFARGRISARMCGEEIRNRLWARRTFTVQMALGFMTVDGAPFAGMSGERMFACVLIAAGLIGTGIAGSGASARICRRMSCCSFRTRMSGELVFAGMMVAMMVAVMIAVMVAMMVAGMMIAGVPARVTGELMFATVAARMAASLPSPAGVSATAAAATPTTAAMSEDGSGQQYRGQRGQSPANAENRQLRAAADEFGPVRRCGALEILTLGRQLDEGFHRATFLESRRSETRRNRKRSKRDGAQIGNGSKQS